MRRIQDISVSIRLEMGEMHDDDEILPMPSGIAAKIEALIEPAIGAMGYRLVPVSYTHLDGGSIRYDARTPLADLEERFGPFLTEDEREEIDTLGGLIATLAGRMPLAGSQVRHSSGFDFEVVAADPRRITVVRLLNPPPINPSPKEA